MGRQNRSKKQENLGKGKVTPIQVAFIVDRYLSDNNYTESRSVFRTEASSLISKSLVREAPKSLLSLTAMLDEYICLKEQKVNVEQEKTRLELENRRVQSLLQGMQNVMNVYNASAIASVPMIPCANTNKPVSVVPLSDPRTGSPPGPPVYNTPTVIPISGRLNSRTTVTSQPLTRNKRSLDVVTETSAASKKSRSKLTTRRSSGTEKLPVASQSSSSNRLTPLSCISNESTMHASGVAESLFNQPWLSPPTNSSVPNTPPQDASPQSDESMTIQEIIPTNCTIISTERVTISPSKQSTCYTIERNRCVSSCSPRRDHVKSRLDFDGSDAAVNETSTSESEVDADLFDLDFPNLDALGENFSFSELLVDLDLGYEGFGNPCCQPTLCSTSGAALSGY